MSSVNYVSPDCEIISFENENIVTTSPGGCNCYFDRWNNTHDVGSGCYGDSEDASEMMANA